MFNPPFYKRGCARFISKKPSQPVITSLQQALPLPVMVAMFLAGDIYVASTNTDIYITKLNSQGNLEWDKSIAGTQYDHATKIIQTKDGGYAVAGNSGDNGGTYMRLVKLSANGSVQWSKYYSANKYNGATAVVQTPDGGYAIGGYVQSYSNGSSGSLIKTDSSGN